MFDCDVGDDAQIERLFADLGQAWPEFDGFVHSIGFAPREAIAGDFIDGLSREAFRIAHDISAYSFPAMAKAALPRLTPNAALLTLTYLGAKRAVPNYNTMGLAKASLEASVRYLAASLGPKGIRVNGISAGPIKTLAASGIKGFGKMLDVVEANAPLRRNVTHRRRGQRRGIPAVRPRRRHDGRDHARGWRVQPGHGRLGRGRRLISSGRARGWRRSTRAAPLRR